MICLSRSRNCQGIELSSRDFKTVAISVTRAKLYRINTWFACTSPSPEAQSPAGDLASAYPPKPLLFTLLGVGACDMLEQIEKLSRYRTIEQGLQNCRNIGHLYARADQETVEVSNYRAGTSKLLQYRSLEQSYTVLTHGLHVRALALRHSPLQAT